MRCNEYRDDASNSRESMATVTTLAAPLTGSVLVGDEVTITLDVQFVKA